MLIFGHPWLDSHKFKKTFSINGLDEISTEEIALLEPLSDSITLAQYCQSKKKNYAVTVNTVAEVLFAHALGSQYVICQHEDAQKIQRVAQEYLFDTKILVLIESEKEIERMAELSIDGVIFPKAIISG